MNLLEIDSQPNSRAIIAAIEELATQEGLEARGAIFTREEVVDFILDLVGYKEEKNLSKHQILEPSFGGGDFLIPIVKRLIKSWKRFGKRQEDSVLADAIRAVELHRFTYQDTRDKVVELLDSEGISKKSTQFLANKWMVQGDFLLEPLTSDFDFVVGNPPYVRQELIPAALLFEYRKRFLTIYDRADLYIPFIEKSLMALKKNGHLGFICADRWMKNRYGGPLRKLVAESFRLKVFIDMASAQAFQSEVDAYPAITVISREAPGSTRMARQPAINREALKILASELTGETLPHARADIQDVGQITKGSDPWIVDKSEKLSLIRRLERTLPTLEEAGCKVGIGVATGADKAFIGDYDSLDVEDSRKLQLVTTKDIASGKVEWLGKGVINPFEDNGQLAPLHLYPKFRAYLEKRKGIISGRHVAQKSPENWYRTIDRITPSLSTKPKLLIPDIKASANIVFEPGGLYPHHNLYFITSDVWDPEALQAVLLSGIARLFIETYSTKMRGGHLRFQAQYLRRIRIPFWKDVSSASRKNLVQAARRLDFQECNKLTATLFNLNHSECAILDKIGEP